MGREIRYRCKDFGKYPDCEGEVVVSERVYRMMAEKGESLPERCDNCRKSHRAGKRETRQTYFRVKPSPDAALMDFCASAYTPHGNRDQKEEVIIPDASKMRIRITDHHIRQLYEKLEQHQVVILASPTGTGKSVYVLYRLLEAPPDYVGGLVQKLIRQGQLIQTQPLTFAVERIPQTVSLLELGESGVRPMGVLGLRHRGREDYDRHNLGVVVTDGSLRNWIRDGHIGKYSLIMVDEAHKRSVNIDNLLALLQYKLPLYPHLKVIIASATINIDEFRRAFESKGISTGVLDLSLTLEEQINYHVHYWKSGPNKDCDCWLCCNEQLRNKFWEKLDTPPEEPELPKIVSAYVLEILKNTDKGSILAFLTGESVIESTREIVIEKLHRVPTLKKIPVLSIYSRLGGEEVSRRFNSTQQERRVLLTTDIAETSHTLDDIVYVIESGFIKQSQWDPRDMTSTLPTIRHSRAGCLQRFGRVGRTQKGYVYCLYPETDFVSKFKGQTTPEIFRSPVDETLLTVRAAGIPNNPSFIGNPDDRAVFNYELKRASSTIKHEGYTDASGNITDEGLDIFRVPLAAHKKALLDLADEQGCLLEMVTYLSMVETNKNDARTGAEIFHLTNGLLVWDPRWTAPTKMSVWRIHNALRTGCVDDLDLVMKLAACYLDARQKGIDKQWAEQNFLNQDAFEDVFEAQEELLQIFLSKAESRQIRELDISLTNKIRIILSIILKGRTVRILVQEGKRAYRFLGDDTLFGIVHEACVGNWKEGEEALLVTATKKISIVGGQQRPISNACSLVKLQSDIQGLNKMFFLDQNIFVGSRVQVAAEEEQDFIIDLIQAPAQINIEYGEKLDFSMLMDDFLRKGYKPAIVFGDQQAKENFRQIQGLVGLIWQDDRRSPEAKVIGWTMPHGYPCAVAIPFDERDLLQEVKDRKKALVRVEKVFKGPQDNKGWVLARTREGIEFPIETGDLSLTFLSHGLQCLEGNWLELSVKRTTTRGMPILSNIDSIIDALRLLRQEVAERGELELEASVDRIDQNRGVITVFLVNTNNDICTFQIRQKTIPDWLMIGSNVSIAVRQRDGLCFDDCYLEDYQVESFPEGENWRYDDENQRLFFPYFLEEVKLTNFDVEPELKERLLKNSWAYGLWARLKF